MKGSQMPILSEEDLKRTILMKVMRTEGAQPGPMIGSFFGPYLIHLMNISNTM